MFKRGKNAPRVGIYKISTIVCIYFILGNSQNLLIALLFSFSPSQNAPNLSSPVVIICIFVNYTLIIIYIHYYDSRTPDSFKFTMNCAPTELP